LKIKDGKSGCWFLEYKIPAGVAYGRSQSTKGNINRFFGRVNRFVKNLKTPGLQIGIAASRL
jgi:hypothetical protein